MRRSLWLMIAPSVLVIVIFHETSAQAQCAYGDCRAAQPGVAVQSAQPSVTTQRTVVIGQPVVVLQQPAVVQQPTVVAVQQPRVVVEQPQVVIQQPVMIVRRVEQQPVVQQSAAQAPDVAHAAPTPRLAHRLRDWYFSRPEVRSRGLTIGFRTHVARSAEDEITFYGMGGVFRRIGRHPRFALELAIDASINDEDVAVPIELSGLVFLNTRGRLQPYFLTGVNFTAWSQGEREVTFLYTGGHFGVGLELLLGHRLGLTFDARTFVQRETIGDGMALIRYGVTFNTGFNFSFSRHNRSATSCRRRGPLFRRMGRRCFSLVKERGAEHSGVGLTSDDEQW